MYLGKRAIRIIHAAIGGGDVVSRVKKGRGNVKGCDWVPCWHIWLFCWHVGIFDSCIVSGIVA